MAGRLTKQGVAKIAQKQASGQPLIIDTFIFAQVDGLDPETTPPEDEQIPSAEFIKYSAPITRAGYVNPAQVVYSIIIGSDVGDWMFNWIGLRDNEGDLIAVVYVPTQQKIKNIPPGQIGNTITRNFLIAYDGLQAVTQITIPAESWQFDITDILDHIENNQRLAMGDVFGRALFFGDGFKVIKNPNNTYSLNAGSGIIEGLRIVAATTTTLNVADHKKIWLDIFKNKVNGKSVNEYQVAYGDNLTDYLDSAQRQHFVVNIATIENEQLIDQRRLLGHQSLVDSISDDPNGNPKDIASIKALQILQDNLIVNNNDLTGDVQLTKEHRGIVNINASAADTIVTLPPATAENKGLEFTIRRADNNDFKFLRIQVADGMDGGDVILHIDGLPYIELFGRGDFWTLYCTGDGSWYVLNRFDTTPIGSIISYTSNILPAGGYLVADGSRVNFGERFLWLLPWLNNNSYMTDIQEDTGRWRFMGDHVLLPDLRSEFLRGADLNRGIDGYEPPGRVQLDAMQKMTGEVTYNQAGALVITDPKGVMTNGKQNSYMVAAGGGAATGNASIKFDNSLQVRTADENRPRNVAYPYLIKII